MRPHEVIVADRIRELRKNSIRRVFLNAAHRSILTEAEILLGIEMRLERERRRYYSQDNLMRRRNKDIVAQYVQGNTLETIGIAHGLTRERVRQILIRSGIGRIKRKSTVDPESLLDRKRAMLRGTIDQIIAREKVRGLPTGIIKVARTPKKPYRVKVGKRIIGHYATIDQAVAAREAEIDKDPKAWRLSVRNIVAKLDT
jgi:hypothetical protein